MSEEQPGVRRDRRLVRRGAYAAGLVVSGACLAISGLGLAGTFDREPTPSPRVMEAAGEVAAIERADEHCPQSGPDGV